ncbi:MAG TPA: hypothetical protein GXX51_05795 [Firmicutes bacterium]|nr:hypothetical protein [Bacillota bacterium]
MLMELLPEIYQDNDDLKHFLWAIEQAVDLIREDIRKLPDVISPGRCPPEFVDRILNNIGWTLRIPEGMKRRLIKSALIVYRQRGTAKGIQNLIRLLAGIECEVYNAYRSPELPPKDPGFYTFEITPVNPARALTSDEEIAVIEIANYMKPSHTHFRITEPYDHWQMDISELGETTILHEA